MAVYLNTYEIWQAYGGPEEGGWWYECGKPLQSILLSDEDYEEYTEKKDREMDKLLESDDYTEEEYNNTGWMKDKVLCEKTTIAYTMGKSPTPKDTGYGGYTFIPGTDVPQTYEEDNNIVTIIQSHFAAPYPQQRPHYE